MRSRNTLLLAGILTALTARAETLDQVIVTATRAPTEIANVTGSASRIDSAEIAAVAATHHSDLLNRVPGAMFQRNSGQESLTAIRSPVLTGPGSCGTFLFMEDSIPIRPVGFCNVNELFEVNMAQAQAVEVIRGPAGSLYGSSAMHGAVNVLSMDPTKTPALSVGLEGGSDSYRRGSGVWSVGEETNALALAALIAQDGGWRDDSEVNEYKANTAWHTAFADSTLDVRLAYVKLDQDTAGFANGFEIYKDEAASRINPNPEAYRDAHATRLNAHWHVPLATASFDLRPYVRSSRMEFLQHFLPGKPLEQNGQDSLGMLANVSGGDDRYSWLVGLDSEYADTELLESQAQPTTGLSPAANASRPAGKHYDYTVASTVMALYGRYERMLNAWRFNVGVRAERVEYDYDNRMLDGNTREDGTPCPLNATGCLYFRPSDRTDSFTTVTPQLGVTWQLAAEHSLYAAAVRGYRAPETTELYRIQRQQSTLTPEEEHIDSIEIGARGSVQWFSYDVAAFTMDKENLILRDANGLNLSNGATKHRGIEYRFAIAPLDVLVFDITGTWADHTYDFTANIAGGESIVAGRDVDTAPRNVWNARVNWQAMESLHAELEWQHVSSYWADAANQNGYEGHDILNLRAYWNVHENWGVVARITNVADTRYADRADFANNAYRYFPGRGRAYFVEARYQIK